MMSNPGPDAVRQSFLRFADTCRDSSPLYSLLASRAADEPSLMALTRGAAEGHPPPNLLLAAVYYLLLAGNPHELASFYPSIGGGRGPDGVWPVFVDFCRAHAAEIEHLASNRRVQTNEVGRCAMLLPAFAAVQASFGRPLHLIETGASAGLMLLLDRYHYEYSGKSFGPASDVEIVAESRGAELQFEMPAITGRVGIDLTPVDATDADAARWMEALLWPDQPRRLRLLRSAIEVLRRDPPRLLAGDGLALTPELVQAVPPDEVPLVFHSHMAYMLAEEWRIGFRDMVARLGATRDLAYVALEWLPEDSMTRLRLARWKDGRGTSHHLANCHYHGRWIDWLGLS